MKSKPVCCQSAELFDHEVKHLVEQSKEQSIDKDIVSLSDKVGITLGFLLQLNKYFQLVRIGIKCDILQANF